LEEVEDWSSRTGGNGGRPAASVKLAAAVVARAREKEREKKKRKKATRGFKYELVTLI
jgi:phosphopantothenoylcysteine synthetase/decarboxylase